MINKELFQALEDFEKQYHLDQDMLIKDLEFALSSGYKKLGKDNVPVFIKMQPEKNKILFYTYQTVVEEVTDPSSQISLQDAKKKKNSYKIGDMVMEEFTPKNFSRIAAQTVKQVIFQKLNDARKEQIKEEMNDKEGEILDAIIRRVEGNTVYVEIVATQMEGVLGLSDQIKGENYNELGKVIKVYVKKMRENNKGVAQVIVSRSSPAFVKRLFEREVPEIGSGLITIKKVVREAGYRTKIAVFSADPSIDAVGACIGPKGSRINAICKELNNERIDVIELNYDPLVFITNAMSPAKVTLVQVKDDTNSACVYVRDENLSLAIGAGGQNARLAARLTDWKIDIKPISEYNGDMSDIDGLDD